MQKLDTTILSAQTTDDTGKIHATALNRLDRMKDYKEPVVEETEPGTSGTSYEVSLVDKFQCPQVNEQGILNTKLVKKMVSLNRSALAYLIDEEEKETDNLEIFGADATSFGSGDVDPASSTSSPLPRDKSRNAISMSSFTDRPDEGDRPRDDGSPLVEVPLTDIRESSQNDSKPNGHDYLIRNRPPVETIHIKRVSSFNTPSTTGSSHRSRYSQRSLAKRDKSRCFVDSHKDRLWFKVASGDMPLWESFDADLPSNSQGFTALPCVCGRGEECAGLSAAYYMLNDPRAAYSEVPTFWNNDMTKTGIEDLDRLRDSLDKYAKDPDDSDSDIEESQIMFIANHHFHPEIVLQSSERSNRALPMFITNHEVKKSQVVLDDKDHVMDEDGRPTGEYYVVPSYGFAEAKEDMKNILWVRQTEEGCDLPSLHAAYSEPERGQTPRAARSELSRTCSGLLDEKLKFQPCLGQETSSNSDRKSPRAQVFATLADFESNRTLTFGDKLESLSSQWHSSVDLLNTTCYESEHAAQLVKQSALTKSLQVFDDRALAMYVATCMSQQMTLFREDVQKEVDKVEELGNAIIAALTSSEARVTNAWDACCVIATEEKSDFWLVEMCYRVSVAYQSSTWKKASNELSSLIESAMETRRERCIRMQGLLLEFVSQQERLVPSDSHACGMDDEIDSLIQELSDTGRLTSQMEYEMNCSRARDKEGEFPSIESPMMSKLLRAAKVVERKTAGVWQPALAVVTIDSFIHVFDLSSSSNNLLSPFSLPPEKIFLKLLPDLRVPKAENMETLCPSTDKQLLKHLTPARSFFLPSVIYTKILDKKERALTLTQKMMRRSGKMSRRNLLLRTQSHTETVDWLNTLFNDPIEIA